MTAMRHAAITTMKTLSRRWLEVSGHFLLRSIDAAVCLRHKDIDRRHDEECEDRADDHSGHEHDADAVARACAGTVSEDERKMTHDGRCRRHENRPQARACRLNDSMQLVPALFLQVVRELGDENAVARYQTDERDQSDLTVDVDRRQAQE